MFGGRQCRGRCCLYPAIEDRHRDIGGLLVLCFRSWDYPAIAVLVCRRSLDCEVNPGGSDVWVVIKFTMPLFIESWLTKPNKVLRRERRHGPGVIAIDPVGIGPCAEPSIGARGLLDLSGWHALAAISAQLRERAKRHQQSQHSYLRASKADCWPCALKQQCCPGQPMRKVITSIHEAARAG
jgi:hypothetical protein